MGFHDAREQGSFAGVELEVNRDQSRKVSDRVSTMTTDCMKVEITQAMMDSGIRRRFQLIGLRFRGFWFNAQICWLPMVSWSA
jgi:hypothetical protein